MEYPLALALEDYLPVLFSIAGLALLTRMIWRMQPRLGPLALAGTIFVAVGGLFKASGKLVMALGGPDIAVLNLGLFPLLAPGFTLFAWALIQMRRTFRDRPISPRPWLMPTIIIVVATSISLTIAANGGPWRLVFLFVMTIANITTLSLLINAAWIRGMRPIAALFLVNLIISLVMSQMAQIPLQTITLQWIEQLVQTFGQACFLIASWHFSQQMVERYQPRLATQPA